tara:strand:- start:11802 stop:12431 length:630 start_codon:yes stop_codon:yes gene_type:complete
MSICETLQIHLKPGADTAQADAAIRSQLAGTTGLQSWHVGLNLEGCWGAGQLTVDLLREADSADRPIDFSGVPGFERTDGVQYQAIEQGLREPDIQGGIWRTLMLQIRDGAAAEEVAKFEQETLGMPRYMRGIRNWRLGRVTSPGTHWTHVWQQEYTTINDLMGEYLLHPYHWGWVDRRFDPEFPDVWVVDTGLCHAFCPLESTIVGRD